MPRPVPRRRFSGASGSGSVSGSRPLPWSAMVNHQRFAGVFKAGGDLLGGVVFVAVEDGVDGGLAHGHGDVEALVLIQAGLGGQFLGGGFHLADALHGGTEREPQRSCSGCVQRVMSPPLPEQEWRRSSAFEEPCGSFMAGADCVKRRAQFRAESASRSRILSSRSIRCMVAPIHSEKGTT